MDQNNNKKRLSNEAMNIVIETSKEVTERMVEKELNYLRENLPKIIADYMFQNKLNIDKEITEKKADFVDRCLQKYKPLEDKIKTMEESFFTDEVIDEEKYKKLQIFMQNTFEEKPIEFEEIIRHYEALVHIFYYLKGVIKVYKNKIEKDNNKLEESLKIKEDQRARDTINRNNRKMYILENYYQKGVPVKVIKLENYENERRFLYDKRELLFELIPFFQGLFEIFNIFY